MPRKKAAPQRKRAAKKQPAEAPAPERKTISAPELQEIIKRSPRQIHYLCDKGMPKVTGSHPAQFPYPECIQWYVAYREELAVSRVAPDDYEKARARKMSAEAELAELDLAERRGELIRLEDAEQMAERPLVRVRNSLQNVPGKYARRFVGLETPAIAQRALDDVVREAMTAMAREEDDASDEDYGVSESGETDSPDS